MEERYEEENWRQIPNYEGWYDISDLGNVRRMKGFGKITFVGRLLKPQVRFGYHIVSLYKNGVQQNNRVHRLVMAAFVGPCPNGMQVNHIDGNKSNNRLENLEYVTQSENAIHSYTIGLQSQQGEKNNHSKLTEEKVHEIRKLLGKEIHRAIAAKFDVSRQTIDLIANGKRWGHVKEPEDGLTNTEE